MSLKKSATRRLSLLAGSSLVAAGLATAAFTGVSLAPGQAFAYDECVPVAPTLSDGPNGVSDPTLNGTTADTFTCTGATFSTTGITYSSAGNLRANATGAIDVGAVGINLTGTDADTVTLSSTGALTGSTGPVVDLKSVNGNITGTTTAVTATAGNAVTIGATGTGSVAYTATGTLTGTSGAVVDVKTASGNIATTVAGVNAAAGATGAVRLESTGAGNVTFTKTGTGTGTIINAAVAGSEAAVTAISHGGNITLTVASGNPTFDVDPVGTGINGRRRGILAQTSGAGSVTLNVTGLSGVMASPVDGIAAVDIVAGTGGADINLTTGNVGGRAINTNSVIQVPFSDALAIRVVSTGSVTIDNTGGRVVGAVDFSGVTGAGGVRFESLGAGTGNAGGDFKSGGTWHASGHSIFSGQNDVVLLVGSRANKTDAGTTIDFGAGTDTFNMSGVLLINSMSISNLEAFNNSGSLFFGASIPTSTVDPQRTDARPDDVLSIHGTTFTGSGASRLYLDVNLNGVAQVGCDTLTGAADCLDLRDSTTAGSTMVRIIDASADAELSGYTPAGITLIDVSGSGASAAGHFTLDPDSTSYVSPLYGAAFDRPGAFVYIFRYDAQNQRHVLVGQPRDRTLFEYAVLSGAAQSIWHMTTETVTDRQGELRRRGGTRSLWMRTSGEYSKRDISTEFEGWDDTFAFDNSYKLYAGTIMGGADLLTGTSGDYDYALGGQIGYVGSSLDLNASETNGKFTGATGGLYGSVWSNRMFLDATFNLNGLALDFVSPALASKTTTYTNSVGARIDGGLRWMLGRAFIEPLATLAFARTTFEEISLAPGEVQPEVANSRRGALGLRLGADLTEGPINIGYFVTGRAWNEFAGDNDGAVHNPGVDMPFSDEFSGGFGEAEAGVNFFNDDGALSGFVSAGTKFKDGYTATNLSLGIRMRW